MKREFATIKLALKPEQMRKLAGGKVIQLKNEMMTGGSVSVSLAPVQHKRLMRALHSGKGYRLKLDEGEKSECMKCGGALKDYFTKRRVRKVVDGAVKVAKPFVKKAIKEVAKSYVGDAGADILADTGTQLAEAGVNEVGRRTGAFGLKSKPKKGGNLKKIGRQIKKGFQKAVDTYKKDIRPTAGPIIRQGLTKAIELGAPALVTTLGAPQLAPVAGFLANQFARQGVDYIGDQTGAFGLKYGYGTDDKPFGLMARPVALELNLSNFLPPRHPAQKPKMQMGDFSKPRLQEIDYRGNKAKFLYGRGEIPKKGLPMNPRMPMKDFAYRQYMAYDEPTYGGSFKMI
jgi:hypothetical protein